jgi:hypothetical protein
MVAYSFALFLVYYGFGNITYMFFWAVLVQGKNGVQENEEGLCCFRGRMRKEA